MPYKSLAQDRFIHAKANEGVSWAKQFVADAHGTHVEEKKPHERRESLLKKALKHHG